MNIVTRFAPSPTGNLHIGGARTAIFNYLYAKKMGGKFYLRIEDTDKIRSKKEYLDEIIKSMKWLKMDYDGELVFQSKRSDLYKKYINMLLETGNAYYCNCSIEDLEKERENAISKNMSTNYTRKCRDLNLKEGVIRFKTPLEGETKFTDIVLGDIIIKHPQVEDFIIARADASPTYNFTVVVDDHTMQISHVIRGDDHVNNTPKQILLFKALKLEVPKYAHVPMILAPDGKKLSKRYGATAVSQYRNEGIINEALFNYLVRLSWSHGDQEIFSIDELKNIFDINKISKSAARLNEEKLAWLNAHYINEMKATDIAKLLLNDAFIHNSNKLFNENTLALIDLVKIRAKNLIDIANGIDYILYESLEYKTQTYKKYFNFNVEVIFNELISSLKQINDFNKENIEKTYKIIMEKYDIKMKVIAQSSRVLLTGKDKSPSVFDIIPLFGKDLALYRLSQYYQFL